MQNAVAAVLDKTMGYKKASKSFGVPQTTLEARVKKARSGMSLEDATKKGLGRYESVFNQEQEKELTEHILLMESRLFGLTIDEVRSLAFELAEKNNLAHSFNRTKKMAGKCWFYSFLKRNPQLSLRSAEPTSLARAMGFNRVVVKQFFDLLSDLYKKHNFTADRVFNVDETGIRTVPNKQSKVLALRGKRQVGGLVSAERGILVTAETCMSASGIYMPTMFVFPRQRAKPELLDNAPPGSTAEYHPSGWMQKDLFVKWFQRFVEFSKPSKEKPVLLLLDGHSTHTKSIELIEMAKGNNVHLLCFPPHCTHRMQPLDVAFMAPLSNYYSQEARKWLQSHPGRVITVNQVAGLYGTAFMKAASIDTAENAFLKTGIFPLDQDIFPDWMFQPAETTNINPPLKKADVQSSGSTESSNQTLTVPSTPEEANETLSIASTSGSSQSDSPIPATSAFQVSPQELKPIPRAERKEESTKRRRGKTAILTSSPYKEELISSMKNGKTAKRKLQMEPNATKSTATKNGRGKKKAKKAVIVEDYNTSSEEEGEEDNAACIYCNELFSNSKSEEGWVKCHKCSEWAHEQCAGIDDEDDERYTCDFCT
ncbi:uncharacterized protein [Periplaneta americana]